MRLADELTRVLLREDNAAFRRWFFPAGIAPSLASPAEAPHVIKSPKKRALRVVS